MVRPGAWQGTDRNRGLECINPYLSPELFLDALSWVLESPLLTGNLVRGDEVPTKVDDKSVERVSGWFGQLGNERARLRRPALIGLASCILAEVVESAVAEAYRPTPPGILAVMSAATEDVARPWTVSELASVASLSPSQLERSFRACVGRPVMAWLDQVRGERAASLLVKTDLPVAEVGQGVGWADPSYVSRRFRVLYGMTPKEYRRRFRLGAGNGQPPS